MSALDNSRLGFIGSGVMAEAMINGLLRQELVSAHAIIASDPRAERGRELAERYGVRYTTDNAEAVCRAQVVVLSVKPQVLAHVLAGLHGRVQPEALVLSIVAGARIATIAKGLGHSRIVRVMPNTPAQIGEGMSVWMRTPEVGDEQQAQAREILRALGEEIVVDHEDYLDMATALSGTGPAYVFLFMEALIDAGVHLGFSRRVAQQLVLQTLRGAVAFAQQSSLHPAELRNMVTSPGGTSAEALYQLEKGGLRTVLSRAVWAAYQKSRYLGGLTDE
ncbi:MAG TPA: pyrroline-5-carboxylate reductase [Anaerolineae bacterium]|nr:pyrroline-5-carboxylate reductase [Anaerolineae bacterium]HPL29507.1 pyrroline-5-carboxylate reductase [Anaerolineae bacterium]